MLSALCVMNSIESWEIDVFWFSISEGWETADSLMYMGFKFLEATFWTQYPKLHKICKFGKRKQWH